MADAFDPNATRPIVTAQVLYRCTCGANLLLAIDTGGKCDQCKRVITPKILEHEMAISTICDGSFELHAPATVDQADGSTASQKTDRITGFPTTAAGPIDSKNFSDNPVKLDLPLFDGSETTNSRKSPTDVMIGQSFGHFELVSPLGQGGMGQVYRALDKSLQRFVAVKILKGMIPHCNSLENHNGETGGNGQQLKRRSSSREVDKLLQEAVTQARLAHPNIVTIYYVGKQDDNPFLAMELVTGKPLNARIAEGDLPFNEIVSIATQIAHALKFSYELDLIHGDIKPSNILIEHDGVAKLSDFGMARNIAREQGTVSGGTPNYIAPELLLGEKSSLQSDIYALGVTLYEMSFRKLPVVMEGVKVSDWIEAHESTEIPFPTLWPDRFPKKWKRILERMLAKNPSDRYADYDELIDDLKKVTPESLVLARPTPRIVAAGIDWISFLFLAVVLRIGMDIYQWSAVLSNVLRAADLVAIGFYILLVYFWRQSLGRSLMHIRVVNRYGLPPKPMQMVLRCFMRMQFPWCAVGLLLFAGAPFKWMELVISSLLILSSFLLLIDLGFMAFNQRRRSLHDVIFDTMVVIDIDKAR